MISQFFVVSMRGDTILHKDCKLLNNIYLKTIKLRYESEYKKRKQKIKLLINIFFSSIGNRK
jgi:hypothetical protein